MSKINFTKWQKGININGPISKFKRFEFKIQTDMDTSRFGICLTKAKSQHSWHDLVYCFNGFNLALGKLNVVFNIRDIRELEENSRKLFSWKNFIKLPKRIEDKPKYKREQRYEKWFFTSQFLKLYNFDFLNNPYGITVDLAWFPTPIFTTLSLNKNFNSVFSFIFIFSRSKNEPWFTFSLTLFSCEIRFEIGENNLARKANLKYVDDFIALINRFANPYIEFMGTNIVKYQIRHKNLPYLLEILNTIDINKFDTDDILLMAADNKFYNKEIFDLLLKHIHSFISKDELNKKMEHYFKPAALKLMALPEKSDSFSPAKLHRKFFRFDFKDEIFETFLAPDGRVKLLHLLIQYKKWIYNLEFFTQLTRKYYSFLWITKSDKKFSWIKFHKDGFSPLIIDFNFCGYFYQFMVTEYHFSDMSLDWNYEKNRPYTTEELIIKNEVNRGENGESSWNN